MKTNDNLKDDGTVLHRPTKTSDSCSRREIRPGRPRLEIANQAIQPAFRRTRKILNNFTRDSVRRPKIFPPLRPDSCISEIRLNERYVP